MAGSLRRAGHPVHVFDVRTEAVEAFVADGGVGCASPAEMAARCEVLVSVVMNAAQTEEVLFGPGGAEIIYRKAKEYDLLGCPIRFGELQAAAARRGEVALGVHFAVSSSIEAGAVLNPPRDETFVLMNDRARDFACDDLAEETIVQS